MNKTIDVSFWHFSRYYNISLTWSTCLPLRSKQNTNTQKAARTETTRHRNKGLKCLIIPVRINIQAGQREYENPITNRNIRIRWIRTQSDPYLSQIYRIWALYKIHKVNHFTWYHLKVFQVRNSCVMTKSNSSWNSENFHRSYTFVGII